MEAVQVDSHIVVDTPVGHGVSYMDLPEKQDKTSAAQSHIADREGAPPGSLSVTIVAASIVL